MKGRISSGLRRSVGCGIVVVMVFFLAGCASYHYALVQPPELQQTIPKQGTALPLQPIEYQVVPNRDQLALQVMNRSAQPIHLVGEKSYVVDPYGATHPLPGGTIAPNAHVELFFPPSPIVYRSYPRYGVGLGFGGFYGGYGYDHYYTGLGYDPWFYGAGFYGPIDMYPLNAPGQWEWKTGEVRTRFVFEGNGTNFEHNLTFDRQREK